MTDYVFKIIVGAVFCAVFPYFALFLAHFETSSSFAQIYLSSKHQLFLKISYLPNLISVQAIKIFPTKIWFLYPYRLRLSRNLLVSYACKISWHCDWQRTTYLWAHSRPMNIAPCIWGQFRTPEKPTIQNVISQGLITFF